MPANSQVAVAPDSGTNLPTVARVTERRYFLPFVLVTELFFLYATGVNFNDVLIPHLRRVFGLADFRSSPVQTAFFGGYFLAPLPAGWVMEKLGYQRGTAVLMICAIGARLLIPAASDRPFRVFLLGLFIMACGSFSEVGTHPYVTILGPSESAERRLNMNKEIRANPNLCPLARLETR